MALLGTGFKVERLVVSVIRRVVQMSNSYRHSWRLDIHVNYLVSKVELIRHSSVNTCEFGRFLY